MKDDYLYANIHQFKTHLSRYVRAIEQGSVKAVIVQRGGAPVGFFIPYKSNKKSPAHDDAPA